MTRLAIALAAVLLLALSSGFTHTSLNQNGAVSQAVVGQSRVAGADQAGGAGRSFVANLASPTSVGMAARADEQPAPALLVYLAFVLASSAVAVALVRRGIGREV
jgi:hypothetical protein